MKRLVALPLAAVAALALLAPSAGAETFSSRGTPAPEPTVSFTAVVRDGDVIKVKKFKFFDVVLACTEGQLIVNNNQSPLPKIVPANNKFSDTFTSNNDQSVKVSGEFSKKGKKAEGTLRVKGDFVDSNGLPLTNCDSGKLKWKTGS